MEVHIDAPEVGAVRPRCCGTGNGKKEPDVPNKAVRVPWRRLGGSFRHFPGRVPDLVVQSGLRIDLSTRNDQHNQHAAEHQHTLASASQDRSECRIVTNNDTRDHRSYSGSRSLLIGLRCSRRKRALRLNRDPTRVSSSICGFAARVLAAIDLYRKRPTAADCDIVF